MPAPSDALYIMMNIVYPCGDGKPAAGDAAGHDPGKGNSMSTESLALRPGLRVYSAISEVELVVVTKPSREAVLTCAGVPMVADRPGAQAEESASMSDVGPRLGKRYWDESSGLEVLCTRAGRGALAFDGVELVARSARALPSSD
jgi:hypothetical protein